MDQRILVAFVLGIKLTEHLHGVNHHGNMTWSDSVYRVLGDISRNEITLTNSPEEFSTELPAPPPEIANRPEVRAMVQAAADGFREQSAQIIRNEREVAGMLLRLLGEK